VLLLHGAAGKGKSAIAHSIATALESLRVAMVPFFAFNRSVKDRSLSQLIPTWAKQLAEDPQYLRYLHDLPPKQLQSLDILAQHRYLIVKGLACIGDKMPLIFTIDALDECPAEDANTLFSILRELLSSSELPHSVRFLFTFRPDKSITRSLSNLPALSLSINDIVGTTTDIHTFVKHQLVNSDLEYMIDDVANASQTLFQCAATLCLELKSERGPMLMSEQHDLLRKVREAPGQPLYATYYAILKLHFNERNVELMELFRRVMSWIFLVQSPQPRQVLQAFAAVLLPADKRSDVDEILAWLGSLLSGTMLGDNAPISPLHASLRDFLLDPTKSHAFSIDLGQHSKDEISWACLRIMNTGLEFNICKLPTSTSFALNSEIEDLPQLAKHISPGLRYACLATEWHLQSTIPPSTMKNNHMETGILLAILFSPVCFDTRACFFFLFVEVFYLKIFYNRRNVSEPSQC
jgi:NACHT domain